MSTVPEDFLLFRKELRESVHRFAADFSSGNSSSTSTNVKPINIHILGPQGSGKTSFIRTCFRALSGPLELPPQIKELELELHRTDDGTSKYNMYPLTTNVRLHDTRGQRAYTAEEQEQIKLVLEGRAVPNTVVEQRKRYWLLLREFWKTEQDMNRQFSRRCMKKYSTLDSEPHFVFLVIDPTQQELLFEDTDFRECYSGLLTDLRWRNVPYAVLCTHGDVLTVKERSKLRELPTLLGIAIMPSESPADQDGYVLKKEGNEGGDELPEKMPETIRIVTNYTRPCATSAQPARIREEVQGPPFKVPEKGLATFPNAPMPPSVSETSTRQSSKLSSATNGAVAPPGAVLHEEFEDFEDVQQDIHILLVLIDAMNQAEYYVSQRVAGEYRPPPSNNEQECVIL